MVSTVASQQEGCGPWTETFSVCSLSVCVGSILYWFAFFLGGGGWRAAGCKLHSIYLDLIALKKWGIFHRNSFLLKKNVFKFTVSILLSAFPSFCCGSLGTLCLNITNMWGDSFGGVKDREKGECGHALFSPTNYNKLYVRPHMSFCSADIHHTLP